VQYAQADLILRILDYRAKLIEMHGQTHLQPKQDQVDGQHGGVTYRPACHSDAQLSTYNFQSSTIFSPTSG
jgi:hypothetical protein